MFHARNFQLQAYDKGKFGIFVLMQDKGDFIAYRLVVCHVSSCVVVCIMNALFNGRLPVSPPMYKMNGHNKRKLLILQPISITSLQAFTVHCHHIPDHTHVHPLGRIPHPHHLSADPKSLLLQNKLMM
jgi:hypothetical protein